ncbi:phosphatidate cytidylyltransferase [Cutibacterium sp. V947]|uniref:phosphatidate cytidylyltransferase n=1 Tax=unclassified Cutibacterium TaxID=2649671 RepID=UPI003EE0EF8E
MDNSQQKATVTRTSRAGRDLPAAITTGVVLCGAVIGTVGWWHWGFVLLMALALVAGAIELHRAMVRLGMDSAIVPICVGTVVMVIGAYAASTMDLRILPNTFLVAALGATTVAAMAWRLPRGSDGFVKDVAASLLTIAYLPLLGCFVPLMMGDDGGSRRIATWILSVVASDTGGYAVGVLFGKHKMAPRISPRKSWEGFAGSVSMAALVGWACLSGLLDAPVWAGLLLGVILAFTGTAGDLVESMIKRDAGIKDMSNFLPGHGGVMDRLDSVLFSAPFAWLVMSLVL